MDKLINNVTDLAVMLSKGMTPEKILGLPELLKTTYSPKERMALGLELISFAKCKHENYDDVMDAWINEFENLNMPVYEAIKRIRLAKHVKRYGVAEFAIFMDVDVSDYFTKYKQVPNPYKNSVGLTAVLKKGVVISSLTMGKEYEVKDSLTDADGDFVFIENDNGRPAYYSTKYFKVDLKVSNTVILK